MSHSSKNMFIQCPLRYKLAKIDRLEPQEVPESQNDLKWGAAVHAGLAELYRGNSIDKMMRAFSDVYSRDLNPNDRVKTHRNGQVLLKEYYVEHQVRDLREYQVLECEEPDEYEIDGEPERMILDLVLKRRSTGEILIWDHKTTKRRLSTDRLRGYELDSQITRYWARIVEKYGRCDMFVLNFLVVGATKAGFHWNCERESFVRRPEQIEYWKQSESDWKKLLEHCKETGVYPAALNSSCNYCEFRELCMSSGNEEIKKLLYKKKVDKPEKGV